MRSIGLSPINTSKSHAAVHKLSCGMACFFIQLHPDHFRLTQIHHGSLLHQLYIYHILKMPICQDNGRITHISRTKAPFTALFAFLLQYLVFAHFPAIRYFKEKVKEAGHECHRMV
jgi:hypothetical protein